MPSYFVTVLICSFLGAAVAANVVVSLYGQAALPFTAFVLIPFDLVARDVLHDRWEGNVWPRMAALVFTGSALSALVAAPSVAVASFCAFLCAGLVDTTVYQLAHRAPRLAKMNLSNLLSSITDSIVFPLVAFSALDVSLSFWQAASKFSGGAVWSLLFTWTLKRCGR